MNGWLLSLNIGPLLIENLILKLKSLTCLSVNSIVLNRNAPPWEISSEFNLFCELSCPTSPRKGYKEERIMNITYIDMLVYSGKLETNVASLYRLSRIPDICYCVLD
jgi:hypothetical protein